MSDYLSTDPNEGYLSTDPNEGGTAVAEPPTEQDKRLQAMGVDTQAPEAIGEKFAQEHPVIQNAATALGRSVSKAIPRSLTDALGFVTPVVGAVEDVKKTLKTVSDIANGSTVQQATEVNRPESFALREADKTAPFSEQRFETGFDTVGQLLMAAGITHGLTKSPTLSSKLGLEKPTSEAAFPKDGYHWQGLDAQGKDVDGVVIAPDVQGAITQIRAQGHYPVSLSERGRPLPGAEIPTGEPTTTVPEAAPEAQPVSSAEPVPAATGVSTPNDLPASAEAGQPASVPAVDAAQAPADRIDSAMQSAKYIDDLEGRKRNEGAGVYHSKTREINLPSDLDLTNPSRVFLKAHEEAHHIWDGLQNVTAAESIRGNPEALAEFKQTSSAKSEVIRNKSKLDDPSTVDWIEAIPNVYAEIKVKGLKLPALQKWLNDIVPDKNLTTRPDSSGSTPIGDSVSSPKSETVAPLSEAAAKEEPVQRNWDLFNENLRDDLDSFSPARNTGEVNYDLTDAADRFVEFAKNDTSGKSLDKLVSDFAKSDEATPSQIKKLRQSVKSVLGNEPVGTSGALGEILDRNSGVKAEQIKASLKGESQLPENTEVSVKATTPEGEPLEVKMDAREAERTLNERANKLQDLLNCLGG